MVLRKLRFGRAAAPAGFEFWSELTKSSTLVFDCFDRSIDPLDMASSSPPTSKRPRRDTSSDDKPIAPDLVSFQCDPDSFQPRPDWFCERLPNGSTALLSCLRTGHITAAQALLDDPRCPLSQSDTKGLTPLILAAQKGLVSIVQQLLRRGVPPTQTSHNGTSALLQASHFGHITIVRLLLLSSSNNDSTLVGLANHKDTTPLMRASQEGHTAIVQVLLDHHARTQTQNREGLTALMLAAQRGHADVCKLLLSSKPTRTINERTDQGRCALALACKRGHRDVVHVLLENGCELFLQDKQRRLAREIAHVHAPHLVPLLDTSYQIRCMQALETKQRQWELVKMHALLQQGRAVAADPDDPLVRILELPSALVRMVVERLPPPMLVDQRLSMLAFRSAVHPSAAFSSCLDLMDELLEEGGLLEALDEGMVPAPDGFANWSAWKHYGQSLTTLHVDPYPPHPTSLTDQPAMNEPPTRVQLRRVAGYLPLLARSPWMKDVLTQSPYHMRPSLYQQLVIVSDMAQVSRRMKGIHLESSVARSLLSLASQLHVWNERRWSPKSMC